jgi:hypothetical protein
VFRSASLIDDDDSGRDLDLDTVFFAQFLQNQPSVQAERRRSRVGSDTWIPEAQFASVCKSVITILSYIDCS